MGAELIKVDKDNENMVLVNERFNNDEILEENVEAYEVLKILGRGENNCLTKKVYSRINNKVYTMKEIKMNLLSEERRKELIDIFNTLKNNEFPNIIKNYIYFQKDDTLYIINEFVENGDLQDFVKTYRTLGKTIKKNTIWEIFLQCAKSLDDLHSHNIIHRDIRLENFLMTDDNIVKLGNFKNAIFLKDKDGKLNKEERFHEQVGGVLYRSPEMRKFDYGKKSDIYSLGVVFYKLCFLDFPNSKIYKNNVKEEQYIKGKYISEDMMKIIKKMLNEDEKERPNADEIYCEIQLCYINKVIKNTSIKSVFTCINEYQNFNADFNENKNKFLDSKKTPYSNYFLNSIEKMKINNRGYYNYYIYSFRDELIEKYIKNSHNDQEINPILVLDCLLEGLNKETSDNFNGPSFKIPPTKFDIKEILKNYSIKSADDYAEVIYDLSNDILKENNYNSIISKYFVGFLITTRFCISCQKESYNYSLIPYIEVDLDKCYYEKEDNVYEYEPDIEYWLGIQQDHICEKHNIYCDNCKCTTIQNESKTIVKIPDNIIIAINWGEGYKNKSKKIKYALEINLGKGFYKLIGVVKRMEDKNGKEYFISIHYDHSKGTWISSEKNNESDKKEDTKEIDPIEHKEGLVVLLFYTFDENNEKNYK